MSGFVDITAETYHADAIDPDTPTLSSSIAKILTTASPAHARAAHPRLNPDYVRDDDSRFDRGNAAHTLLLEGIDKAHVLHFDSFRTKDAKEQRDAARADGLVPMLVGQWDEVRAMVAAALEQLGTYGLTPQPFTAGKPEQCITFEFEGVLCRALIDWLHETGDVADYKSTSASAHPLAWGKTALGIGADLQVAFHSAAVEAVTGRVPSWVYVVQETYPPYQLTVLQPSAGIIDLGRRKMGYAVSRWAECLAANEWPGYEQKVELIEMPGYAEAAWLEREAMEGIFS